MQLIVQVNSLRENQSESVAIISSRKKNKTKQNKKSLIREKKVPRAWGISDCVKEQNSRLKPM